jgi:aspartyl-tRNA(Asn)/glutamyl-tRNA(Gln) amidotransferase subunit C
MKITTEMVEYVSLLSRLEFSDEEKEVFSGELSKIIDYFEMINQLDTENVPPTSHILEAKNILRKDEVGRMLGSDNALNTAPKRHENFFQVPQVIDEGGKS